MIKERTAFDNHKGNLAGSGITNEVAAQRIEELRKRLSPSQFNALERAANRVWAMNRDNLDRLVEFGIMSKEQAETWKKLSPHYVPLRDDLEALGIEMPYGTSMAGQNYIKAVGRFSESTTSQFAWSILQAKQGAMWAEQNYINNIALNFCMQNASKEDYRVTKLPMFVKKALSEAKGFREEDARPLRASVPEELDAIKAYRDGGYTVVQGKENPDVFWVDAI